MDQAPRMNHILEPKRFGVVPTLPNAEKLYKHWKRTFTNYLRDTAPTPLPETETEQTLLKQKQMSALINCISADVFEIIGDIENYDDAIDALDAAYLKPLNVVYNRHLLITCKQDPSQTVDAYFQELSCLAKACSFQPVLTAQQNMEQYVRDAFISGIGSSTIRQHLLENRELKLPDAFQQARALEQAQKQYETYESRFSAPLCDVEPPVFAQPRSANNQNGAMPPPVANSHRVDAPVAATSVTRGNKKGKCYFCGGHIHPARHLCPAVNDECGKCKKIGHWAKVCRSKNIAGIYSDSSPSLA